MERMRLVVSEKNIAARRIAEILAVGRPESDKVYTTPVYKFRRDGEDWVSIGLKGHIMKVDFPEEFGKWKLDSLDDLVHADVMKLPAEKGIIRSLQNLAKKAEDVVIATDYDREGELIGSDARELVLEANGGVPISRARFSAITKEEIEKAFAEQGKISDDLAEAGATRQDIDLIWGAVLTRYLTLASNNTVDSITYGAEGNSDQSLTLEPEGDWANAGFVRHTTAKGSGGSAFSPGTRVDGTQFGPASVPAPAPLLFVALGLCYLTLRRGAEITRTG
jgi:DNA topoisomerase IA